ncbi:MAG: tRNA (adenosine(37)-N6)-threonylcarbamoyltransferase complex dimerization subunit type 1 TsaB [Gammaproteobacteria bacterium SHHR-1]|uniref:tRNA (adenosine(37)-N6)-threonylcarbamoyltransferase complex dimerization subunit type 1 TsaB n=1 Tax=Magnetovirga frankeli TaxID=947516 RepID=UPI001293D285|nr:tRNA (adenosine(37)-N6)-threonylcarbamoyltransferase complex dimerization subunit type 1 TsaB [gamma proteobacterium SS-5]
MKILALDTSAEACSVALNLDGELIGRLRHAPRRHTELILPMLEQLLAEAGLGLTQLDAIAFGRGPGSFTGVRIAAGVTQGIALGAGLAVVPISTLAALALRGYREQAEQNLLAAFDARMKEIYWGAYRVDDQGLVQLKGREAVLPPEQASPPEAADWFALGSGWAAYPEALRQATALPSGRCDSGLVCRAEEMALLAERELLEGRAVGPEQALPLYLRDRVAWSKG